MNVKFNSGSPKKLEANRIAEIKKLSHLERLERLMVIIEVSYLIRTSSKIQFKK